MGLLLMSRMEEYFSAIVDPWNVGFTMAHLEAGTWKYKKQYSPAYPPWTPERHAARVRYLMSRAGTRELTHPIEVDCECSHGRVHAEPVLIDGWHRYTAHRALERKTINVMFGGRLDLRDYLAGKTDEKPER